VEGEGEVVGGVAFMLFGDGSVGQTVLFVLSHFICVFLVGRTG